MTEDSKQSLFLADEAATVEFGRKLGHAAKDQLAESGFVVFLVGDLGAGKTTLCRGVLSAFGHKGAVKSPTYTLVEPYDFEVGNVRHFDLYRLGDPEELEYMGIRDYFAVGNLCLIEWPNRGQGVLPEPDLIVTVTVEAPGRRVKIQVNSRSAQRVVNEINNDK